MANDWKGCDPNRNVRAIILSLYEKIPSTSTD